METFTLHDPLRDRGLECKTSAEPLATATIEVVPSFDRHGRRLHDEFDAFLSDEQIARATKTPFCCAARALIKGGWSPATILVMRHRGSTTESLSGRIDVAARLTVREDRCGPRFDVWKPMPLRAVDVPIAPPGEAAATPQPSAGKAPGAHIRKPMLKKD